MEEGVRRRRTSRTERLKIFTFSERDKEMTLQGAAEEMPNPSGWEGVLLRVHFSGFESHCGRDARAPSNRLNLYNKIQTASLPGLASAVFPKWLCYEQLSDGIHI